MKPWSPEFFRAVQSLTSFFVFYSWRLVEDVIPYKIIFSRPDRRPNTSKDKLIKLLRVQHKNSTSFFTGNISVEPRHLSTDMLKIFEYVMYVSNVFWHVRPLFSWKSSRSFITFFAWSFFTFSLLAFSFFTQFCFHCSRFSTFYSSAGRGICVEGYQVDVKTFLNYVTWHSWTRDESAESYRLMFLN